MKSADINLETMLEFQPREGKVMLGGERMLIFRQHALGVLRRLMYEQTGAELARGILGQFGYQCGRGDYENLMASYDWDTERDTLTSGPMLHTWEGIVLAEATELDYDREAGHFHMRGVWTNSYEAEIHLRDLGESEQPVCHSLAGYASGWATAFMGCECLAIETSCVAAGDDSCRFEVRDAGSWGPEAEPWRAALASSEVSLVRELEAKLELINEQQRALEELTRRQRRLIGELSAPILQIWPDVLVVPIIGAVDRERGTAIMDALLAAIARSRSRCVILDITGMDAVDVATADYLISVVKAAGLLGTHCVVTGVSPSVAQSLVDTDADLSSLTTLRDLEQGLAHCIGRVQDPRRRRG